MVDDPAKALDVDTRTLGFVKKTDVPAGGARWITVVSPEGADGVELVLEPIRPPAAAPDAEGEHRRLEDTSGNVIHLDPVGDAS